MGTANLATIFGLTLMGNESGVTGNGSIDSQDNERLAETQWQVKVVQTILDNYRLIFEPDEQ